MNTPAKDVATKLVSVSALGLFIPATAEELATDWGVYVDILPDSPARCISIVNSTSPEPQTNLEKSEPLREDDLQIKVRGLSPEEARQKADVIGDALYQLAPFSVVDGTTSINYLGVLWKSGVFPLGWDDRRRYTVSFNMRASRYVAQQEGE